MNTPNPDEPLRAYAGFHMKRAFHVFKGDLDRTLKEFDLRLITYSALVLIVDTPGLRQAQLADALQIERPNFVMIIDELEKRGLIFRDRAPTDRRANALKPTLSGQALCKWATEAVDGHEQRVFGMLTVMERQQFLSVLAKIELGSEKDIT